MNMNRDIVNRSLYAAGKELLKPGDETNPEAKTVYDLCKTYFLSTYLEALSEVPWTSAKRRRRLLKTRKPHNRTEYRFVYDLPYDCARPVELLGKEFYVIEGNFLCTDAERAALLYVTNGRVLPKLHALESPGIGEKPGLAMSTGDVDEWDIPLDVNFCVGSPCDIPFHGSTETEEEKYPEEWDPLDPESSVPLPEDPVSDDDYPEYRLPDLEPKFWEYVEKMLAAKFAMKNTEQPRLHDRLLAEALLIKQDAINTTRSNAAAQKQPSPWWGDRLGLGGDL